MDCYVHDTIVPRISRSLLLSIAGQRPLPRLCPAVIRRVTELGLQFARQPRRRPRGCRAGRLRRRAPTLRTVGNGLSVVVGYRPGASRSSRIDTTCLPSSPITCLPPTTTSLPPPTISLPSRHPSKPCRQSPLTRVHVDRHSSSTPRQVVFGCLNI